MNSLPDPVRGNELKKGDRLGGLVRGQVLFAKTDNFFFSGLLVFLQHHRGLDGLSPFLIGDAEYGGFQDLGVLVEDIFDFGGIDVFSAGKIMSFLRSTMLT